MSGKMLSLTQNPFYIRGNSRIDNKMATSKLNSMPSRSASGAGGKSSIFRILLAALVLILVAGGSVAGTWYFTTRMQAPPSAPVQLSVGQTPDGQQQAAPTTFVAPAAVPAQVPSPIFVPIEAFTVTLQNAETERIMHVGITLRVSDEQSRLRLEKYMPEVRSRILMVLSAQSPTAVQTPQGKLDMASAITQAVKRPFSPLPDGQYVSDVLFTAFVVQ